MKRKFVYILLSVLIAFGLWLYVVTVVNPEWEETFYNIPVVLENEEILHERGLMLISEEDPKVTLRLSGNRADMIKLNSANITIRADLSRIYSAGEQTLTYSIVYPGDVPNNAFEIVSQTPQQITLTVVERKSVAVDVIPVIGKPDTGYVALEDDIILSQEKITIAGPADMIDSISHAEIHIDLAGQRETINKQSFEIVLRDTDGNIADDRWIKATPQKIECTLKIQKVQDVEIAIEVLDGAGLTAENYEVIYYNQETGEIISSPISISGSETQLAVAQSAGVLKDNKLFFDTKIDLAVTAGTKTENGLEIVVSDLNISELLTPYELVNQSEINVVKAVVRIKNRDAKTLRIIKIDPINVPEGLKVEIKSKYLDVTIRGIPESMQWIKETDITIQVDFANAVAGDGKYAATVIFTKNYERSFVVGNYVVNATVTPV